MSSAAIFGTKEGLALGVTWLDCPELGDLANTFTWCELTLTCAGVPLTRHTARGNVYESVVIPAAPIAAWIGHVWSALVGEERLIEGGRASSAHDLLRTLKGTIWDENEAAIDAFIEGHALYRVRGGLLLPNVIFWRRGEVVDVSWRASLSGSGLREVHFVEQGQARIPANDFFDCLRQFVKAVAERASRAPETSFLRGEVEKSWRTLCSREDRSVLAARLGRSASSLSAWLKNRTSQQGVLDALAESYGPEIRDPKEPELIDSPIACAARSASPAFSDRDQEVLIKLGAKLRQQPAAFRLQALRDKVKKALRGVDGSADYEAGYARAAAVRRALRNLSEPLDIEAVLQTLGCAIESVAFDDVETDGVALWTAQGQALVAANTASARTASEWGRRAMMAHELYHLIFDASAARFFGECTSDWSATPTEREANAFAAELLLPALQLPSLPRTNALQEWRKAVRELLKAYRTGWELTVRHLRNRGLFTSSVETALLNDLKR